MIIDGLPALPTSPTTGDELPIERGTDTYKIDYNALASAIISKLGGDPVAIAHGGTGATTSENALINLGAFASANVYNGLDKTVSGFALDARQGKCLNDAKLDKSNLSVSGTSLVITTT